MLFRSFLAECELAAGAEPRLDAHLERVRERATRLFEGPDRAREAQFGARRMVEELALALQASLLVRHAPSAVADAFCVSRLERQGGHVYGTLPSGVDAAEIVARAVPA